MRKQIQIVILLPLLMLAVSCSGARPENFSAEDQEAAGLVTAPAAQEETPPADSPDPTDGTSNQAKMRLATPQNTNPMHLAPMHAITPEERLQRAFEDHAAFIDSSWSYLSSSDREDRIQRVAKAWKNNLGEEDLDSLQEALAQKPIQTLNKFVRFEAETIESLEEAYKKDDKNNGDLDAFTALNALGRRNLHALKGLQNIHNPPGNQTPFNALQDFGKAGSSDLGRLEDAAQKLRPFFAKAAGFYGLQDYFGPVNELAQEFKNLSEDFQAVSETDRESLSHFLLYNEFPLCTGPVVLGLCEEVLDTKKNMHGTLSQILQDVSFTYSAGQGSRYWSFFKFDKKNGDGSVRGEVGGYETQDLIFVKESELK